jgi:hypothetical protein
LAFVGKGLWAPHALRHAKLLFERHEFVDGDGAERAGLEPFAGDAGERDPRQSHDGKSRSFAHPPNLLVSTFSQREREPRLACLVAKEGHFGGLGHSVFQTNPSLPALEVLRLHLPRHLHDVGLWNGLARMEQPMGEIAVVGREKHATGREVETAHGKESPTGRGQKLPHRRSPLRIG